MAHSKLAATRAAILSLALLLAGCGGGGSDSDEGKFSVGGTLSGLATGATIVLRLNNGLDLVLGANGNFGFSTKVEQGGSYAVTVQTQPAGPIQVCTVTNGTGTIAADVTNVAVSCITNKYKVKGTLAGLAGGSVVLQNNAGDDLTLSANGTFEFPTAVDSGGAYKVTVLTQPVGPPQTCVVTLGLGFVTTADVTTVAVNCTVNTYSVGGTVTGLSGSGLVLRNNGGNDLTVSANGAFTFTTKIASGAGYLVTVQTQPASPNQTCTADNASGTVVDANITNVNVTCVNVVGFGGGTVRGLDVPGLVLRNSAGEQITVNSNGTFKFATPAPGEVKIVATPASPRHVCQAVDMDITCEADRFAYVTHSDGLITALVANHETGALSPIAGASTFATGAGPVKIVSDPRGRFIYVANYRANTVSGYRVDPASGALAPVPGSPFAAGAAPDDLAIDSKGRFLYATASASGKVLGWAVRSDGSLKALPGQPAPATAGNEPCSMQQAPLSSSLFKVSGSSPALMMFAEEADSSLPKWVASKTLSAGSYCGVATDPYGHFVYVPKFDGAANHLFGFKVGEDGATLEPLALSPSAPANAYALSAAQPRAMVLRNSRRDREILQIPE